MLAARFATAALLCAACSQSYGPDTVSTGIYDLTIRSESDACAPSRATGAMGPVAVLVEGELIDAPVPEVDGAPLTAPRVRLRPDASFHAETNTRIPGCESAWVHEEWTLTEGASHRFELLHTQRWNGLAACPSAQDVMPQAPASDCESERHLDFTLAQACNAPCSLGLRLDAPGGVACACPRP